jgi:flagellar motor switch protein FliM
MSEESAQPAISEEEVSALLEKTPPKDAAQPFDLAAHRINRTQLPMLDVIARSFAERAAVSLSGLLGREATVRFETIQTAKAADLHAALPVPASFVTVRIKPLSGFAFVNVEPALLLTLLDGFFGGSGRVMNDPLAAIAPAAQRFLSLMIRGLAADFGAAWAPVAALELEFLKQETNPRFIQIGAPRDTVLVVGFSIEFGSRSGRMEWLLPDVMLTPMREALASETGKPAARSKEVWAPVLGATLQGAEVETRAVLAKTEISLRELVRLTPGDIIPIEPPQQATLLAGDVPLYRGRFGVSQGRNALKILSGGSA